MVETVTRQRLATRDHYRLQLNLDQQLMAYVYNAMADYYPRPTMERVRNEMALVAAQQLRADAAKFIKTDRAFAVHLKKYLDRTIEPALQSAAAKMYRELGWSEDAAKPLL